MQATTTNKTQTMQAWKQAHPDWPIWIHTEHSPSGWGWNTVAARLQDASLLLTSPTFDMSDSAHVELKQVGLPRFILVSNHYHTLGVDEFVSRYRSIQVLCSEVAKHRLTHKLQSPLQHLDAAQEYLPPELRILEPAGTKTGEVWVELQKENASARIVADAFFNLLQHPSGLMNLPARLTQVTPGLQLGKTFRCFAIRDRTAYKHLFERAVTRATPTLLVRAHGNVLQDAELARRLLTLVHARL
jgi:hypothetical protein